MSSCFDHSKNLQPDVNVPTARIPSFPFLINSSCSVLLSHPNKEQQQVSNNGRPAKWVGGVYTRCATLVTDTGHDNPSLKIPLSVWHPAEAGLWPETINLRMIINPHNNSLLFIGPLYCPADGRVSSEPLRLMLSLRLGYTAAKSSMTQMCQINRLWKTQC